MTSPVLKPCHASRARISLVIRPRLPHWLAVFVVLAGISLPDCCLNGSHLFGAGMEAFGAICRARS